MIRKSDNLSRVLCRYTYNMHSLGSTKAKDVRGKSDPAKSVWYGTHVVPMHPHEDPDGHMRENFYDLRMAEATKR